MACPRKLILGGLVMSNSLVKRESGGVTLPGVAVGAGGALVLSLLLPFWLILLVIVGGVAYGVKKVL